VRYCEYGVPQSFIKVRPFEGALPVLVAYTKYFDCHHGHSGSRVRGSNVMRGSDLTLVKGLSLRVRDRFLDLLDIEDDVLTLNPARPEIDPIGYGQGTWVVLHFKPGSAFAYCEDYEADEDEE
jgi:hypothetical protein